MLLKLVVGRMYKSAVQRRFYVSRELSAELVGLSAVAWLDWSSIHFVYGS